MTNTCKQSRTNSDGSTRTRMRQSGGAGCCHEKKSPLAHGRVVTWPVYQACWGAPRAIPGYSSGFRPPNLPAFAWRATGDISAEVFSMSKPSVEISRGNSNIHSDRPHNDDDDDDDDDDAMLARILAVWYIRHI